MENTCIGNCESHTHGEVSRKGVLAGLATVLTGIGLVSLGETAANAASLTKIAKTSAVPVGSAKSFTVSGKQILITQPKAGVYRAFRNQCTHQGAPLPSQSISGGSVACYVHGASFNATSGAVTRGPAPTALPRYTVTVKSGYLYVTI